MGKGGFSWKRATGVTKAKQSISKKTRIPFSKSGRQRKIGKAMAGGGCMVLLLIMALSVTVISALLIPIGCSSNAAEDAVTNEGVGIDHEEPLLLPEPDNLTAEDVVNKFQQAGLPIGEVIYYTEETCPNGLLGRPGQYIGKASWEDTRIEQFGDEPKGGTVEVFDSENNLIARKNYLEPLIEQPMFLQYMFIFKNVIVRLEGRDLTPSQAEEYNQTLINAQ